MSKRDEGKVRRTRGSASGRSPEITLILGGKLKRFRTMAEAMNYLAENGVAESTGIVYLAVSDDASGTSVTKAATSPAASAAHFAYAEAADGRNAEEAVPCVPSEREKLPPGEGEMPQDRAAFAEAVFARADLIAAWAKQVNSDDEKTVQRAIEKLDEMRYASVGNEDEQGENKVLPRQRYPGRN